MRKKEKKQETRIIDARKQHKNRKREGERKKNTREKKVKNITKLSFL